eukprot:364169-Chlamydomonas_euryale.AAC.5
MSPARPMPAAGLPPPLPPPRRGLPDVVRLRRAARHQVVRRGGRSRPSPCAGRAGAARPLLTVRLRPRRPTTPPRPPHPHPPLPPPPPKTAKTEGARTAAAVRLCSTVLSAWRWSRGVLSAALPPAGCPQRPFAKSQDDLRTPAASPQPPPLRARKAARAAPDERGCRWSRSKRFLGTSGARRTGTGGRVRGRARPHGMLATLPRTLHAGCCTGCCSTSRPYDAVVLSSTCCDGGGRSLASDVISTRRAGRSDAHSRASLHRGLRSR